MHIHRILLPTDFSACANAALTHAVALAGHFDAELHLLHVTLLHHDDPNQPGQMFPAFDELHRRLEEAAASQIEQLIQERETGGLTVIQAQCRGIAAAPAILDYAASEGIDLIVLGTHGRRGLRHFLLGSVAEEVVRVASCPVLTVRDEEHARQFHRFERILVPCDFSDDSARALDVAAELARLWGSRIELVHVIVPLMDLQAKVAILAPALEFDPAAIHRRAESRLGEVAAAVSGPKVEVKARILDGEVASALTRHAESSRADLIVIASHGLSGLERYLLGSVAAKVIRSAKCPVLTLRRPAEDASDP